MEVIEKTLVLIKPDGVKKGLIGEIISRIEQRGLKVIALKMANISREQVDNHYPKGDEWITRLGTKTMSNYNKYGISPKDELGVEDEYEIGKLVRSWLLDFLTSGPVVKMVVQGVHAIDMVRKICGNTIPSFADMGTIRGDYSVDSPAIANSNKRSIHNIVHASETQEEANNEIKHWFGEDKLCEYRRNDEV